MAWPPASDRTKCPKLDGTLKLQVPKDGKDVDRALSYLQTFVLDAVALLTSLLEKQQAGCLTMEGAAEAVTQAIRQCPCSHLLREEETHWCIF